MNSSDNPRSAFDPHVWVIDLDGVVWLGDHSIPGSAEAIRRLQDAGRAVVFATNNASMTPEAFETRLNGHGISSYGNVVTSAQAAATLVTAGERVYVIGEAGLIDAVSAAGAELVGGHDDGPIDAVVMGITRSFDYDMLRHATRSVLAGARLIASNTDTTFPASDGIDPGNGALVAAVETATGRRAEVAGKPHQAMAKLVASQWQGQGICVGDRPETDGDFAVELGYAFGLVFSGVTLEADLPVRPEPRIVAADLERLVESVLD